MLCSAWGLNTSVVTRVHLPGARPARFACVTFRQGGTEGKAFKAENEAWSDMPTMCCCEFGCFLRFLEKEKSNVFPRSHQERLISFYLVTWNARHPGELIASVCQSHNHDNS